MPSDNSNVNAAGEKVRKTLEHMNVGADLDAASIGVQSFTDVDGDRSPLSATAAGQSSSSKSLSGSLRFSHFFESIYVSSYDCPIAITKRHQCWSNPSVLVMTVGNPSVLVITVVSSRAHALGCARCHALARPRPRKIGTGSGLGRKGLAKTVDKKSGVAS